jgi:hypothetical protein
LQKQVEQEATRKERLNNLQRECLIIGAASFNSLGLIRSEPDAFYNNDLIKKNTNMNSSCKNKWNIVKQISGIKGSDMSIPPILYNDNLIFDDHGVIKMFCLSVNSIFLPYHFSHITR